MANEIVTEIRLELDKLRADLKDAQKAGEDAGKKTGQGFGDNLEGGMAKAFGGVTSKLFALGASLAGAFTLKEAISEAMQQESAINALNSAMAVSGTYSEAATMRFQDFAGALQRTTATADDVIERGGALLVTLGQLSGEGLERATKASLDLAAGLNIDVGTAFNLMSKAATGNVGVLSRYGFQVKATGDASVDFANALAQVEGRMRGMAEMQSNTFAGALSKTKNQFGEVLESVGNVIIKSPTMIKALNTMAEGFSKLAEKITQATKGRDLINELGQSVVKVGLVVNTYLVAPLELAFNILRTGALTIATAFTGLISVFNYVGQAITQYLIKPVVDFIGGALGRLISIFNADLGASIAAFVAKATTETSMGFAYIADQAAQATAALAASTAQSANDVFNFDVAATSEKFLTDAQTFFETVTPPIQTGFQNISDAAKPALNPTMFQSFSDGFMGAATKIAGSAAAVTATLKNLGAQIFNTMATGTANAFAAMGAAMAKGENGMKAFGNAMIGVLGDIAIQFGTTFIGMGIAKSLLFDPTGPLLIAAGASLAVLGGALKAMSGTGGGAAGAASAGAGAGSGGGVAAGGGMGLAPVEDNGQQFSDAKRGEVGTAVNINIAGNVLDRRQTGLEIAEVINEAFGSNGITFATGAA